jgi:hypothetical protein
MEGGREGRKEREGEKGREGEKVEGKYRTVRPGMVVHTCTSSIW